MRSRAHHRASSTSACPSCRRMPPMTTRPALDAWSRMPRGSRTSWPKPAPAQARCARMHQVPVDEAGKRAVMSVPWIDDARGAGRLPRGNAPCTVSLRAVRSALCSVVSDPTLSIRTLRHRQHACQHLPGAAEARSGASLEIPARAQPLDRPTHRATARPTARRDARPPDRWPPDGPGRVRR